MPSVPFQEIRTDFHPQGHYQFHMSILLKQAI